MILVYVGVIESALLSGLVCAALPLAGMVCAGSGPNLQNELLGSGCPTGFPDPDLFDRFAHAGRRLLTLPVFPSRRLRCCFFNRRATTAPDLGKLLSW